MSVVVTRVVCASSAKGLFPVTNMRAIGWDMSKVEGDVGLYCDHGVCSSLDELVTFGSVRSRRGYWVMPAPGRGPAAWARGGNSYAGEHSSCPRVDYCPLSLVHEWRSEGYVEYPWEVLTIIEGQAALFRNRRLSGCGAGLFCSILSLTHDMSKASLIWSP